MAVIRILLGVTFLSNGLAKLFDLHRIEIGPYVANLINRGDARFILDAEVNTNARHQLPLIGRITNDLVLPNWDVFGWGITAVEIVAAGCWWPAWPRGRPPSWPSGPPRSCSSSTSPMTAGYPNCPSSWCPSSCSPSSPPVAPGASTADSPAGAGRSEA